MLDEHKLLLEQTRWMMRASAGMTIESTGSELGGLMFFHHPGRQKGYPRE